MDFKKTILNISEILIKYVLSDNTQNEEKIYFNQSGETIVYHISHSLNCVRSI